MYFGFNEFGHCEIIRHDAAVLPDGLYYLKADYADSNPFAWSDGVEVWFSNTPPPSHLHQLQNGEWVLPDGAAVQQLATAKADKLRQLNVAAQACIDAAAETDKLPPFEVQTWALQAAEAKAWAADSTVLTPVLDGIAAARGVPVEQLKTAALQKTLAYEALTAHIAGQRQALQSKIEAASTQAELDKIKIEFTLPDFKVR